MNRKDTQNQNTREALLGHYHSYPGLQMQDIFKFLYHSAMGCEHLVTDERAALAYIQKEYSNLSPELPMQTDPLDGDYSRVPLSLLRAGLSAQTLARLFCLSARCEPQGKAALQRKLQVALRLAEQGLLPFDAKALAEQIAAWANAGYPAIHHSEQFRAQYHPSYRVIANRYAAILPLLTEIDKQLARGNVTLAIDGGSASGKSTLAELLQDIYPCTVFHMDDFFLRPEQRTAQRLAEVGGNVDRERFLAEVLTPLTARKSITYRPYNCASQMLGAPITCEPSPLTVIEGVYAMHPLLRPHYTLSVFLDVDAQTQRARIVQRNSPAMAKRFFEQWILLENVYFSQMHVPQSCTLTLQAEQI